jgi:hypothetical protein
VGERGHPRGTRSAYVSIRQHTSAYVSIRQHTSAYLERAVEVLWEREGIREVSAQHTSAYVSIRQHTSAYLERAVKVVWEREGIREVSADTCSVGTVKHLRKVLHQRVNHRLAVGGAGSSRSTGHVRQHTRADVSIRQHTPACVSILETS